jgi:cytidylate kinase
MGVSMVEITVSGHPGSGTSTLVSGLMNHFDWSSLNGGAVFREEAKRRGMSLADFGALCATDLEVDRQLDALLQERMSAEGAEQIVESRLSGWWAYRLELDCVRMWVDVTDEERARRVVAREGGTFEQALAANANRTAVDAERFTELYGILPEQREPYTIVLDATHLSREQVLAAAIEILEASS